MQTDNTFTLEFPAVPPRILWALAADTNRVSRAIGLAAGDFTAEADATGQIRQVGRATQLGFGLEWVTGPDSWIEGAWYRTVRRYRRGPAREAIIEYRVQPRTAGEGGCRVVATRHTDGNLVAVLFDKLVIGGRLRNYLEQSVQVAARCVSGPSRSQPPTVEVARALSQLAPGIVTGAATPTNLAELGERRANLKSGSLDPALLDKLADYLSRQSDEAVADLSPVRFAEWAERPLREVLRLFLLATQAGLLELRWSLRCQSCRTSAATVASLEDLPGAVKCPGCGGNFGPDLATHVEAAFGINQGIRRASVQRYCTAGAATRPHVFAQLVAAPDAPCEIEAPLLDGPLTLRVLGLSETQALPRLPATLRVTVRADGVSVEASGEAVSGATKVSVRCEGRTTPAVVLLERLDWGETWVSAAQLATVPEFHELFGGQAPRTRHEVSVGTLTLLFTDLRGSTALYQRVGDPRAFTLVSDHFDRLKEVIEANEGALIKTMGDAVMAVFQSPPAAVRAALAMQRAVTESETEAGLVLKLGVHVGNCLAVRANGRLDLFGHNVNLAARTQAQSLGGDIVVTEAVLAHPEVGSLLQDVPRESFEVTLKGIDGAQRLWRLRPTFGTG